MCIRDSCRSLRPSHANVDQLDLALSKMLRPSLAQDVDTSKLVKIMGGGAWPFLVGVVICLVNSVNERDLNLLNSVEFLLETKMSS